MSTFKQVLVTAAGLVVASALALTVALQQAGQSHGMTCEEWRVAVERASDEGKWERFFVAVQDGTDIPEAHGTRVLGDCSAGTCTILPQGCDDAFTYDYDASPLVAGWRVVEMHTHPYFAGGWKPWAAATAGARWYGSLGQVVTACQANFTGSQCLDLLQADDKCWLLDDGQICRYNKLYGPGVGGTEVCPYANVLARLPCRVLRGAGTEISDVAKEFTDADLNVLD